MPHSGIADPTLFFEDHGPVFRHGCVILSRYEKATFPCLTEQMYTSKGEKRTEGEAQIMPGPVESRGGDIRGRIRGMGRKARLDGVGVEGAAV